MLRSCLYDYSDAYVVVKETITVEGDDDDKKRDKKTGDLGVLYFWRTSFVMVKKIYNIRNVNDS